MFFLDNLGDLAIKLNILKKMKILMEGRNGQAGTDHFVDPMHPGC
jgi:hypothetical protein